MWRCICVETKLKTHQTLGISSFEERILHCYNHQGEESSIKCYASQRPTSVVRGRADFTYVTSLTIAEET